MPASPPSADQVARGWLAQAQRASRLHLPEPALVDAVTSARCELLLTGPGGDDPVATLLGIAELVRLGDAAANWVSLLAEMLERVARSGTQIPDAAVCAAARVLHAAGEDRAVEDLRRMRLTVVPTSVPDEVPAVAGSVPVAVESRLVLSDDNTAAVLPHGFPATWLGVDFEAHGLPIGLSSCLSFAVRWHGSRPAILWEITGPPMVLRHRHWSTAQVNGEALLPEPGA
jgi:hypothetical protein